jgi:secreted protein with Ig-like and vWFA domain
LRDQVLIFHGTGGDGKTTFCNLISFMLNNGGVNDVSVQDPDGLHKIKQVKGLAGTMKVDTLLQKPSMKS